MMKTKTIFVLIALTMAGCDSSLKSDTKAPPPPPQVKPAPLYKPEALDPTLRAKAREELLSDTNAADPFIRSNALESLSDVNPGDAAAPILKGLGDADSPVRFS